MFPEAYYGRSATWEVGMRGHDVLRCNYRVTQAYVQEELTSQEKDTIPSP